MTLPPWLTLAAAVTLALPGCPGDHSMVVTGEVVGETKPCTLELYGAEREERYAVYWHSIAGSFRKDFVVAPAKAEYYFILSCPGAAPVRTRSYETQDGGSTEINLGRIVVARPSASGSPGPYNKALKLTKYRDGAMARYFAA